MINPAWPLALAMGLIGVPALAVGATMLKRRVMTVLRGALIEAEVLRWDQHRLPAAVKRAPQGRGSVTASTGTPSVRYVAADGKEFVARLDHQFRRETWVRYPVGARMPVRIDPAHPTRAYDPTIGSMFVFPGLLSFAGLLMSLLALGIVFG